MTFIAEYKIGKKEFSDEIYADSLDEAWDIISEEHPKAKIIDIYEA